MLGGEVFGERGMGSRKELPPSAMWTSSEWASDLNFWVPKVEQSWSGEPWWSFFFQFFLMLLFIGSCFSLLKTPKKQGKFWYQAPALKFNFLGSGSWIWKAKPYGSVSAVSVIVIPRGQKNMSRVENCVFSRSQSGAIEAAFYMAVWSEKGWELHDWQANYASNLELVDNVFHRLGVLV